MMWPWSLDESQQTLFIAILAFIGAFLLTHYLFSFRSRTTAVVSDSNSYDELVQSLLSQYSAKFAAITKLIESINLRLELLERALEQIKLGPKSEVVTSKPVHRLSNLSLLTDTYTNSDIHHNRNHDASDLDLQSDITKSYHQLHDIHSNDEHHNDADDISNMTQFVLRLLSGKPLNTIEIQSKVSRSREHTSRFMKRLFLEGLVSREMNTKPFVYMLTDEGRKQLKVFRNDV